MTATYLPGSEEIAGYKVKIWTRKAFRVFGFTMFVPRGRSGRVVIPAFYSDVIADGRLAKLTAASTVRPWVLGLGSWDPECEQYDHRYTICIEETAHTDYSQLAKEYSLFTKQIGASDWMCFELTMKAYGQLWKDDPYKMMGKLGYEFHGAPDYSLGVHFDAYPPGYRFAVDPADHDTQQPMEFWISVKKP